MTRRIRAAAAHLAAFCLFFALTAPAVFAYEGQRTDGEGLLGETDDKLVTFFSLGVLIFFVLVVSLGTIIQSALDRRKDEKQAARMRQRTGW